MTINSKFYPSTAVMCESNILERFWSKVEKTDGCWIWRGTKDWKGYGDFMIRKKHHRAHKLAYELLVGSVPENRVLDHLCRNRGCVNPAHLEPVTNTENIRRGVRKTLQTHCKRGHPLEGDNLRPLKLKKGVRECVTCHRQHQRLRTVL